MALSLTIEGTIARLSINRPDKRNALDQAMWETIPLLVDQVMTNDNVRVLILCSANRGAFSAGADIGEFAHHAHDPAWRTCNQNAINAASGALANAAKPVIAQIEGDCIGGGCSLALACDLRIATPDARFGITPAKLGIVYPFHDTRTLVDMVGPARAKKMLFTGALLDAAEALRIGLIDDIAESAVHAALDLAHIMASRSQHSVRESKAMVRRILDGQREESNETLGLFHQAFDGPDFAEGIAAFLEKRTPNF
jgi:enoyl-CoA hydratase/carnithine racemase